MSMSSLSGQRLHTAAFAAAIASAAVTLKFLTGGWFFYFGGLFLIAPAIAVGHVFIHVRSCDAANRPAARLGRLFSHAALLFASLAEVDFDDHCSWYAFALLTSSGRCLHAHPLFGHYHNIVVLAPLLGTWLVLWLLAKGQRVRLITPGKKKSLLPMR